MYKKRLRTRTNVYIRVVQNFIALPHLPAMAKYRLEAIQRTKKPGEARIRLSIYATKNVAVALALAAATDEALLNSYVLNASNQK